MHLELLLEPTRNPTASVTCGGQPSGLVDTCLALCTLYSRLDVRPVKDGGKVVARLCSRFCTGGIP